MKLQTKFLTGAALDWCVAKCEESDAMCFVIGCRLPSGGVYVGGGVESAVFVHDYTPSTNWAQGGPIIEREGISVSPLWQQDANYQGHVVKWYTGIGPAQSISGPTPLIAAMRCLIASKLGPEVEVPEELCK